MERSAGGIGAGVIDTACWRRVIPAASDFVLICLLFVVGPARAAAATSTLVMFDFGTFGTVQVDLFTQLAPQTVNNFLGNYVSTGAYSGTFIHRNYAPLNIVQGGGYPSAGGHGPTPHLTTAPPIPLEYAHPNMRGTIAMARTSVQNSATSEWFFNLQDNSTGLGPANGGGYAVFGQIVGPGLSVMDAINALPRFSKTFPGSQTVPALPLSDLPLKGNITQAQVSAGVDLAANLVFLNSVSIVKTHAAYQNPFNFLDTNNSNSLTGNDAAVVIQDLLLNGIHDLTDAFGSTGHRAYVDVNGDGKISALDVAPIVQALLLGTGSASAALMMAEPMAMPMIAVPEPTSLLLAATAATGLIGFGHRRQRARRAA